MEKPFILAFSGLNSCGKSSFIKQLADSIQQLGKTVEIFHCPDYQSETGKQIKEFLEGSTQRSFAEMESLFH